MRFSVPRPRDRKIHAQDWPRVRCVSRTRMGTGSPTNRRKRKRTQRTNIAFVNTGRRSSWSSLPCFAILFGLALIGVVYVLKSRRTKAVGTLSSASESSSSALSMLLQEQHEIGPQVMPGMCGSWGIRSFTAKFELIMFIQRAHFAVAICI